MSPPRTSHYSEPESDPPFDARQKARVRTDWKTISLIVGGAFTAGIIYMAFKAEIQALAAQTALLSANQVVISTQLSHEHDTIKDVQSEVHALNMKLDYLVDGRRGPAPARGSP